MITQSTHCFQYYIMLKKLFIIIPLFIIFLYFGILAGCAEGFFYYPDRIDYQQQPEKLAQTYDKITFSSHDGTKLTAWFVHSKLHKDPKEAIATVIYFHGNAGNLTGQYDFVSWLPERGFNVFIFDYRGFGFSEGKTNIAGLYLDSDSALNFIRQYPKINPERLVVLGQSLGGNNTIAVIGRGNNKNIKAVVIDSTFYSYSSIANEKLWGGGLFLSNKYSAYHYIANISPIPLLMLHGKEDTIIPYQHAERLFQLAKLPKQLILIPQANHVTTLHSEEIRNTIVTFYKQSVVKPSN